jgi:hypothetical protein
MNVTDYLDSDCCRSFIVINTSAFQNIIPSHEISNIFILRMSEDSGSDDEVKMIFRGGQQIDDAGGSFFAPNHSATSSYYA